MHAPKPPKVPLEVAQAKKRVKRPPKKNTTAGYTLDPGQKAALEKKFDRSWHSTFTSFSFFDSFKKK